MSADLDRLAELEEERRFLLRSLADLEREYEAGDVDEADYRTLKDGYTARAASVLRGIDDQRASLPAAKRRNPWVVAVWVLGTIALAVVAGWAVAQFSGQRLAGQTITGGLPGDEVNRLLAEARANLGADPVRAVELYQEALEIDPRNSEALTYLAWLVVISSQGLPDEQRDVVVAQGITDLQTVIDRDPTYADAVCFLAVAQGRFLVPPDVEAAQATGQQCLDANPPGALRALVKEFIAGLEPTG
jgi:cytochrome c-type biogenesis protein CcmH/NrfG